ncbi:hypothetical protein KJ836_02570 [Patescibacteria group bacterium]|nr:hypothetical protein [Patescibacteria group bacterium]
MCGVGAIVSFRKRSASGKFIIGRIFQVMQGMINRGRESYGIGLIGNNDQPNTQWKAVGPADGGDDGNSIRKDVVDNISNRFSGEHRIAIGHVRYPTSSEPTEFDAQPHHYGTGGQRFVLASNGDLPFCEHERMELKLLGYKFESNCDAEVIVKWIGHTWNQNGHNEEAAFLSVGAKLKGAFSLVTITPSGRLFVMRDPIGYHPLYYATDQENGLFYVCSESAVIQKLANLDPIEVKTGQLLVVDPTARGANRIKCHWIEQSNRCAHLCGMEYVYFNRPDSIVSSNDRRMMNSIRMLLGQELGREWRKHYPVPDAVCYLPRSGEDAAAGFRDALSVAQWPIIKKDTAYRIFMGSRRVRSQAVRQKLTINPDYFNGNLDFKLNYVVVVDDSIVRGDQSRGAIADLKAAGCKKVGFAVTWPLHRYPCFYGLNTGDSKMLIGYGLTDREVMDLIGADYLHCLSLSAVQRVLGHNNFCHACATGKYLTPIPTDNTKLEIGQVMS